jgi:hypothetical protein
VSCDGKELGDDKENNSLFLMTWNLKRSMTGANSEPNSKKMWLGQLAPPACNNGDRPAQERQREKTLLNAGFDDVDGGAGHRELNEWQVSKLWCLFLPSPLSQTTLDFVG